MQPLQTTVLNKIYPGVTPIFIISPNPGDGDNLAILLSNNIVSQKKNKTKLTNSDQKQFEKELYIDKIYDAEDIREDALLTDHNNATHSNNFFINENIRRTFIQIRKVGIKKITGYKDSLKFFMEEGLENNTLWGMNCTYKLFFDIELHTLFPNALYIILYQTHLKDSKWNEKILNFFNDNQTNCLLFNENHVTYLPKVLLASLPFNENAFLRPVFTDKNITANNKHNHTNNTSNSIVEKLNYNNWLLKSEVWYTGKNVLAILLFDGNVSAEIIINKIQLIVNQIILLPDLYLICKNEDDAQFLLSVMHSKFSEMHLNIRVCDNIGIELNDIISKTDNEFVIIDNLSLSYSFLKMLSPFRRVNPPVLSIKLPNEDIETHQLLLPEILLKGYEIKNFSFSRKTFLAISGFDTTLNNEESLWDFCIRVAEIPNSYVITNNAVIVDANAVRKPNEKDRLMSSTATVSKIFNKHIKSYENNIVSIIAKTHEASETQQLEKVIISNRVSAMSAFAEHSKNEAKLLLDLTNSLNERISLFESRWHYKVSQKIGWLKRIFFNESTGKSEGLLKIIKFFIFSFTKPGLRIIRLILKSIFKKLYLITENRPLKIVYLDTPKGSMDIKDYDKWIRTTKDEKVLLSDYNSKIDTLKLLPKISILVPVYDPPIVYLKEAIESVISQTYTNWELCLADDCSPNPQIAKLLNSYALQDTRIKVVLRTENGHISASSNSALAIATGDYVLLLDHDDILTQDCLFEVVKHINEHPEDQLIYSDEDKIDENNRYKDPFFKPDWSPDKLLANNYISHVAVYEKKLIDSIKGFRLGYEGSQDYDLLLRASEQTKHIGHIPKILYHWRIHEMSVAGSGEAKPYAYIAAKRALASAFLRRNIQAEVLYTAARGSYKIKYNIENYDKVSVIIPTKDAVKLTKNTIDSIFSKTSYPNYEIIVLNNNSTSNEFYELMKSYENQHENFRCIEASFPFNFSKLINLGVSLCSGKYVLMLNNDVEIINNDWMTEMVSLSQNEKTGAVGVKLLYPDDTIQHAGVVIGFGPIRVAGHVFLNYHKNHHGYFNYLQTVVNYSAVTAACLMVRKDIFEEVGGMNEDLEVEYNDVDFCLKIREHGYFNVYTPDVVLYHYESATRGHPKENKVSYERHLREVAYFKNQWGKYIENDPYYNPNLSLDGTGFDLHLSESRALKEDTIDTLS